MPDLYDFSGESRANDQLVEYFDLLEPYKVFQDKIWQRIWLTELEMSLVDTDAFQRLRWKMQLGTTILVYPNATHTRFEHSIGALEGADEIVQACNKNYERYRKSSQPTQKIGPYVHFLTRIGALLHDLAQMAYGHTLQDEGHVVEVEWNCSKVRETLLSTGGLVPKELLNFFQKKWDALTDEEKTAYKKQHIPIEDFVKKLQADLEWILAIGLSADSNPPREYLVFVADIVGNTFSGDLIDYVQRDTSSLGLTDGLSLIPMEFAVIRMMHDTSVDPPRSIPRLVLALWKPLKPEKTRRDIVRYIVDLFDKRCRLAEDVYFHPAKMAASAMIAKSAHLSEVSCSEIWESGDIQLLEKLSKINPKRKDPAKLENCRVARELALKLMKRHLLKNAYEITLQEMTPKNSEKIRTYSHPKSGADQEREFEKSVISFLPYLSYEDVAAYCPDPKMNLKAFSTLVWPSRDQIPKSLIDYKELNGRVTSIEQRHKDLWRFTFFVDPLRLSPERLSQIKAVCFDLLLEDDPKYDLSRIWIENFGGEIEQEFKSRRIPFSIDHLEDARRAAIKVMDRDIRKRATPGSLRAPKTAEVIDIALSAR